MIYCYENCNYTLETLFTPNLRRIGSARNNCTDRASRKND